MTWPEKDTRRVSLRNGQSFLWHLDADWETTTRASFPENLNDPLRPVPPLGLRAGP